MKNVTVIQVVHNYGQADVKVPIVIEMTELTYENVLSSLGEKGEDVEYYDDFSDGILKETAVEGVVGLWAEDENYYYSYNEISKEEMLRVIDKDYNEEDPGFPIEVYFEY